MKMPSKLSSTNGKGQVGKIKRKKKNEKEKKRE
jgi:hypothetical protein